MAEEIARAAWLAANNLKTLSNDQRTAALKVIHDNLRDCKDDIIKANKLDMQLASENDLAESLQRRLDLTKGDKYDAMLQGILDVAALEDPMGKIMLARHLDDELDLYKVSCPVGVLLVIFESRPEVIANITALAIKSGNAAILKGGKESLHTFSAMSNVVQKALTRTKIPPEAIQLVASREQISKLLLQDKYIDLVIPRGSNALVRSIKTNTKIPVLGHADGICSIYVDKNADMKMASRIIIDSKVNYPAGCNAVETLLFDEALSNDFITGILEEINDAGVTIKASPQIIKRVNDSCAYLEEADMSMDFDMEFLSLKLAVDCVSGVNGAINHINEHGSGHTDSIITGSKETAEKFMKGIDSSGVYWNASTRFADGFRYGFGTEVGISTNKIHARGPVGLEGLMTYQYQLRGNGQIAGDYRGAGGEKSFKHEDFEPEE